ncbi:MAG: hypothetical protein U0M45_03115 [Lachnospiraceae bacterium]|nr:hypothetical protein [Dorea sp.]MEE0736616.1 hypothetical protein [Lachnospiraceae bacterium]
MGLGMLKYRKDIKGEKENGGMDIRKSDRSFQQWCDCDLYDRGSCFGYEIACV